MRQRIEQFMERECVRTEYDGIIVGFSGGADSVCLLTLLAEYAAAYRFPLVAVHVNHGIRGTEADADESFCREFCAKRQLDYESVHVDVPAFAGEYGLGFEEAGRMLRYEAFGRIGKERGMNHPAYAVGHHLNDQAETVLFRVCRGSSLRGLCGMRARRGNIIRPLLTVTKEEILRFCNEKGLSFCTDSTNADNEYARNALRNEVFPLLKKVNVRAEEHIAELAKDALLAEDFLTELTEETFNGHVKEMTGSELVLADMESVRPYLAGRVIYKALGLLADGEKDLTHDMVDRVCALLDEAVTAGTTVDVRGGLCVRKENDGLYFFREIDGDEVPTERGELEFTVLPWDDASQISNEVYTKFLDYDKIFGDLRLRHRMGGDYLVIDREGHRKSLNRYFIDEKIPARLRDRIWVLADGDHVVWVIGGRLSHAVRVDGETTQVLRVTYKKLEE